MLNSAVKKIKKTVSCLKVGILAKTATYNTETYDKYLTDAGTEFIKPFSEDQENIFIQLYIVKRQGKKTFQAKN